MGVVFNGVQFDVNADRLLITSDILSPNAAHTVMAWLRVDEIVPSQYPEAIVFCGSGFDNTNSYEAIGMDGTGAALNVGEKVLGNTSGSTLTIATWYHVAKVRDSATGAIRLYLNAVSDIVTAASDVSAREAPQRFELGGFGSQGYSPFQGALAYARAWSAALTAEEIAAEMSSATAARAANLYGDWPLSGGVGVRNLDVSGNGRDWAEVGTLADVDNPTLPAPPSSDDSLTYWYVLGMRRRAEF